jgi:hypothetical protein
LLFFAAIISDLASRLPQKSWPAGIVGAWKNSQKLAVPSLFSALL